jgi:hypothetical protein
MSQIRNENTHIIISPIEYFTIVTQTNNNVGTNFRPQWAFREKTTTIIITTTTKRPSKGEQIRPQPAKRGHQHQRKFQ